MPRRPRRPFLPPPRSVVVPPREACWIESDAYDRSAFAGLLTNTPRLSELAETGGTLIPHFRELLEDIFCLLFKLIPSRRSPGTVAPSAALGGQLLTWLVDQPLLDALREQTRLDEPHSGLGTLLLGRELLDLVRSEQALSRGDLKDLWDLKQEEDTLRQRADELTHVKSIPVSETTRDATGNAARVAEARLRQKSQQIGERLRELPATTAQRLALTAGRITPELGRATSDAEAWSTGLGAAGRLSPARQVELGHRLLGNARLRRLAELLGRMRPHALALRKRTLERANTERYAVEPVRSLEHLLPSELANLRHPLLRRDLIRRLMEGQAFGYELRGHTGYGPMVVCVDGSSSMSGEKEIWAKAVALTLLEIARRQRRLFRFIGFAGPETPLTTIDLNPRDHHVVRVDRALEVAEVFPGGGTDFQKPLDAAVDCLSQTRYRRGDVVFLSDGECRVAPQWAAHFAAQKARLGFRLFAILIDVGASTRTTLETLCDRLTTVRELTESAAGELFASL